MQCVNILFLTIFAVVSANKDFAEPPPLFLHNQLGNHAPIFKLRTAPYYPMNYPPKPYQMTRKVVHNLFGDFDKPSTLFDSPVSFPFYKPEKPEIIVPDSDDKIMDEFFEEITEKFDNLIIFAKKLMAFLNTGKIPPVTVTTPRTTEFKIETTTNKETNAPTIVTTQIPTTTVNTEVEETVNDSVDEPSSKSENSPSIEDTSNFRKGVPDSVPNIYGYKPVPMPHNYPALPPSYMPYGYPPMHASQMYPGLNPNIPWPSPHYHPSP